LREAEKKMLRRNFVIKRVDVRRELRTLHNEELAVVFVVVTVFVVVVTFIVCSVLFCVMCVSCVLCLIVELLPLGKNPFAAKIINNTNYISPNIISVMKSRSM
jgi:hypothetical protein